jgi:hypothetical protein
LKQQISRYNPEMWRIFQQMMDIAARKVTSYFNDVAIVDAGCLALHNPRYRFYWMVDQQGSHWGAANLQHIEMMQAAIKVFGYRETLDYYVYDPNTGLVQTTKEALRTTLAEDDWRIRHGALKTSTPLEQHPMPKRLIAAVKAIRARDVELNHSGHNGRYYYEETMLAWTAPKKFYVSNRSASWGPSMWPADDHLYFLLAARAAFQYYGAGYEDRWLPETYIYRNGRLDQVTMPEMQADIVGEIAKRLRTPKPARQAKPLPIPAPTLMMPTPLPVMQPALFG